MAHCSHFGLGGLVCLSWRKKRPPRCLTDLMDHVFFKQSTCFLSCIDEGFHPIEVVRNLLAAQLTEYPIFRSKWRRRKL